MENNDIKRELNKVLEKINDLDINYLKTLGPVEELSLEEIFGY